jgi:hypothetical protein
MLSKFLGVFFPGFSWFHGFALWDIGSALSIGGSIAGGLMGSDAAGDAADAQSEASAAAIAELRKIGERTRSDTAPYRSLGSGSANLLSQMLGINIYGDAASRGYSLNDLVKVDENGNFLANDALLSLSPEYRDAFSKWEQWHQSTYGTGANLEKDSSEGSAEAGIAQFMGGESALERLNAAAKARADEFSSDPSFGSLLKKFSLADLNSDVVYNKGLQFGLDEGMKALDRRQLALGGYDSGAAIKAATRYANDYGETKAAGAQNRFMGDKAFSLNALLGTTNVGQNAVNTDANTGAQMAQAIGGAQMGAGNARAAGIVGGANAWSNALTGAGNAWNTYQQNEQTRRVLDGMGY